MKRILFVIPTMRMGGAEQSLCNLLRLLPKEEFDISLLLFAKEGELLERIPEHVHIMALPVCERAMVLEWRYYHKDLMKPLHPNKLLHRCILLVADQVQRWSGKKILDGWQMIRSTISPFAGHFDVAISYLEGTAAAYVIDKVDAARKIGWIHTDFGKHDGRNFRAEKRIYSQFHQLVTISDMCRESFCIIYPELSDRILVLPNLADTDEIRRNSEIPIKAKKDNRVFIATVGRLEFEKGIDLALEAASELKNRGISFDWEVFGDGSLRQDLERQIEKKHLEDVFFLRGVVSNPYPYMKRADIIVQTSRYEGKSIVLDEAKILGKPIVVTDYPSVSDQIKDGVTGLITEFSPQSVADAIIQLLHDVKLREKLIKNCIQFSDGNQKQIEQVLHVLQE